MTDLSALHTRYDGTIPAEELANAAFGSQHEWAVAQTRERAKFYRREAMTIIGRLRRLNGELSDPTLPLKDAARLEDFRERGRMTLREYRARHGHHCARLGALLAKAPAAQAAE